MKIRLTSSCDKDLSYKIYGVVGGKRKLACKGKFLRETETAFCAECDGLIVRIKCRSIFISFLAALYIGVANLFNLIFYRPRLAGSAVSVYLSLYPFDEIKIGDLSRAEIIEINYNKPPLFREVNHRDKTVLTEYLTCRTHPYLKELSSRKAANGILYALSAVFWLAIIGTVCFLIAVYVVRG